MPSAYYDASRSQNTSAGPGDVPGGRGSLVVVALLCTEERWKQFDLDWHDALERCAIPHLDMARFVDRRPPYDQWKNESDRTRCMISLIDAVVRARAKVFSCGVLYSDFARINESFQLLEGSGGPYALCALACLRAVKAWAGTVHPDDSLQHVVERGDPGLGEFLNRARELEGTVVTTRTKAADPDASGDRWFAPFQAADMIAWEWRNVWEQLDRGRWKTYRGRPQPPRASLSRLRQLIPQGEGLYTIQTLAELCRREPERFPPRRQ